MRHWIVLVVIISALVGWQPTVELASGQEESRVWQVNRERGESTDFSLDATEGTWLSLDVSPDGTTLVFDLLGHLYRMPIGGGSAEALTSGRSWNMFPRFSPDGTRLAFTSDRGGSNDLWVLHLEDGSLQNVSQMDLPVFQGSWSRDGRHLYATALNMRVRFPAYRFNFFGKKQEILPAGERTPVNHFQERATDGKLYFVHNDRTLFESGPRIKTYDLSTGEVDIYLERPGGAASPRLSPDGQSMAYVHRDDQETVLVLHDLETREERVLSRLLDRGRLESRSFYGSYSNISWHPSGDQIFLSYAGGIHSIDLATGEARKIDFVAPVRRKVNKTHRVRLDVPEAKATTRSHRWALPTRRGVLFEALGNLYLKDESATTPFADDESHETNPVYDERSDTVYYASWTDTALGSIVRRPLVGGPVEALTDRPSQYGSLALSPNGNRLAFIRGAGTLRTGQKLEDQVDFELMVLELEGGRREPSKITDVSWSGNRYAKRPPAIAFDADGQSLFFTEFVDDRLTLKRIRTDGEGERSLYRFLHATRASLSPDAQWVVYREYHRSYVTPFEFAGHRVDVSAADDLGFSQRVDSRDGDFTAWTRDGKSLYWTRGGRFYQKALDDVLTGSERSQVTELAFDYSVDSPESTIALTGARVLTMNEDLDVVENATILVVGPRIVAVGSDVAIPDGARVFDLAGRTIMPGIFDAHGHYGSPISALNVVEQNLYGLRANLAYGVTTMYDVYGTTQKDFWVSDMLRAGKIEGPRLFSVGDPMFVTKYRTKMYRAIESLGDAEEHVQFNKDHGATSVKDYSNHRRGARQQLMEAARREGVNIITESFGDPQMNMTQVIDGFTGIEHSMGLTPVYEDVLSLFAHTEIGMTPTLIVVYNGAAGERYFHQRERLWEDEKLLNFFRRDELMRYRRTPHYFDDDFYHVEMARELRKLHERGVLLQMGAHGQMMGLGAHWEIEMFVHGGFSPMEALQIATINGYRHHGLDHELGAITSGKLADLVVLRNNPLDDIRHTRDIDLVLKHGVVYSGAEGARVFPDPSPAPPLYFNKRH